MKQRPSKPLKAEPTRLALPTVFECLFLPSRYKVFHGGRGSAKSWSVAAALVAIAYSRPVRVLCARELQNSITDSVHKLLCDQIDRLGLSAYFTITANSIRSFNGSEFLFKGLRHNVNEIKSTEGIDICWVEEAQRVSESSWEVLIPTIRKPGSEIWVTFNPSATTDPTYLRFIENKPDDAIVVEVNFDKNPFFPEVLRKEMDYMRRVDFDAYEHVWLGKAKGRSKSLVLFGKWRIDTFGAPPEGTRFYYGVDWGFAQDPSVVVRCFIIDRKLFIDHESYGIGVELDELSQLFDKVPGVRQGLLKADNSRPETISHMAGKQFSIRPARKWAGSVEDGLSFLRSFEEIVIHERCRHTAEEASLYSYKVDRVTEEVLPVILDKHNHCWDAVRYALDGLINRGGGMGIFEYMKERADEVKAGQKP